MACFARPDTPNEPIRSTDWPDGETVTLRPRLTWAIESEANARAFSLPAGTDWGSLSPQQASEIAAQNMNPTAVRQHKMARMITAWTLRFEPTAEQREKGEPGDIAPLTPEMIAELPPSYADWIAAEIEKRGGALPVEQATGPDGDPTQARFTSRSGEPSLTALAPSSNARSQRHASSVS